MFKIDVGISPESRFFRSDNVCKLGKVAMERGMVPLISFLHNDLDKGDVQYL
jgi:hypothetical protein